MKIKVYQYIARELLRVESLRAATINLKPEEVLHKLEDWVREHGPSGAGIDCGTRLENSSSNRLALKASFHHMDENGYYDGWTNHMIIVKPDLAMEIDLHISGQDRNEIKDYLHEVFRCWLTSEVEV